MKMRLTIGGSSEPGPCATILQFAALSLFAVTLSAAGQVPSALPAPPPTEKIPVTDTYHGVSVVDNYRWLENADDPRVKTWVAAQNVYAQAYLSKLPQRPPIVDFLKQQRKKESAQQAAYYYFSFAGGKLFALKSDANKSGPTLVFFLSPVDKASEHTVVDLNTLEPGKVFGTSWYKASPDGSLVGMALSVGGSEDASLYVFDTATGKQVGTPVPRVQFATAGGDMAWAARGNTPATKGFYYTRYPQGDERPAEDANFYQQLYYHVLGSDAKQDKYILGKTLPRIAEIAFTSAHDGKHVLVSVEDGDGGRYEDFLLRPDGSATQVTHFADKVVDIQFGADDSLWLLSHAKSDRGELDHIPAGSAKLTDGITIVPPMEASIEGNGSVGSMATYLATEHDLYVTVIDGGPEKILKFTLQGQSEGEVPAPPIASVGTLLPLEDGSFIFSSQTYLEKAKRLRYNGTGQPVALPFSSKATVSFDDAEVRREFAISKDGTRIPMSIIMRKGTKLDGTNPVELTAYGGYGISINPYFIGDFGRLWLDHGGIFVEANVRGGAEYGESWHLAGNLLNKQNVFDDFAACAHYLIDHKYTSPNHLAIEGGSNGGLLMGAEFIQHPELYRTVLSEVGIYDMLRTELEPNGSFNVTEFGTVKDPALFKALYAYSPYHHVQAGEKYPAILFVTGDNDHRVDPMQSRKMTAELQAKTTSGRPVLLRTSANAGHGMSTDIDEALEETADTYAFLFAQLGMDATPAKPPTP